MKFPRILSTCITLAGVAAAAHADDAAKPAGSAGVGRPAAVAVAAAPAPAFTDAQMLEQIGWIIAKRTGLPDFDFSPAEQGALIAGYREALAGQPAPYEMQKIQPALTPFMQSRQEAAMGHIKAKRAAEAAKNAADGVAFFAKLRADNKAVQFLPDGLGYEIIQPGTGAYPKMGDKVRVNYSGALIDGTVFDASGRHGGPQEFTLGQVITGWNEGLQKVAVGGKIKLYLPPSLAYGDAGNQGIPSNATLVFDVDLLGVTPGSGAGVQPVIHLNAAPPAPAAAAAK